MSNTKSYSSLQSEVLKLIQDNTDTKRIRDSRNEAIMDMFDEGFDIADDLGPRKITSQMLFQAHWRLMNKIKPLDFQLHANGRKQYIEQLATYGLTTLATKGEYIDILRNKNGIYWNSFLFGDGFYMLGTQENDDIPFIASAIPNSNIYVDQFATAIRATKGRGATKVLVIFSMPKETAWRLFPQFKRQGIEGSIPREYNQPVNTETGRSYNQTYRIGKELFEVGYYYNIEDPKNPCFAIVGGSSVYEVLKLKGEKYPFVKNDEPYIPVGQHSCMGSARGFWNFGVGDLLYRLAVVNRRLLNLAIGHAEESVWPDTLVSVAQGTASQFFQSMQEARKGRSMGLKPIIPIEYDPASPNGNRVASQTLATNAAMNEFVALRDILNQEIRRCGITLDDLDINPQATQYQILAEEEKATAFIKQVQEQNASDQQFSLEVMLDLGKKFIKKKNDTPIDIPVALDIEGVLVKDGNFTLGQWADEIKKHHYFVKVDSRTGAIPSNVAKQTRLQRILPLLPPGSPGSMKAIKEFAALNDYELDDEAMQPPMPPAGMPMDPSQMQQMPINA